MSVKTKTLGFVLALFVLLFSYQNCQKNQFDGGILTQISNFDENKKLVDLANENISVVRFYLEDTKVIIRSGNSYQINYTKILKINLSNGKISESSDIDDITASYCLTEPLINELNSILKLSQVCQTQPNLPEGMMCTQVVKLPYAQIIIGDKQYDLGSASDGCGNNAVDLCGDQAALLKAYIENFKEQYTQMSCE